MNILVLVAGIIVIALSLIYVVYPLFGRVRGREAMLAEADSGLSDLLSERDAVLQAIRDLDFDYRLGKLSNEDYETLRAQYTARGVAILQQLDAAAGLAEETAMGAESLEEEIEAEVRRLRRRPAPAEAGLKAPAPVELEAEIEAEVRKLRARPEPATAPSSHPQPVAPAVESGAAEAAGQCPNCGQPYLSGDKFCAHCGHELVRTCPSCGTTAAPDDRFCSQCGTKL